MLLVAELEGGLDQKVPPAVHPGGACSCCSSMLPHRALRFAAPLMLHACCSGMHMHACMRPALPMVGHPLERCPASPCCADEIMAVAVAHQDGTITGPRKRSVEELAEVRAQYMHCARRY